MLQSIARRLSRDPSVAFVMALLTLGFLQQPACAQIDTQSARDARATIRQLRQTTGQLPVWGNLTRQLDLDDATQELRAGNRAEPAPLASAAERLRTASMSEFRGEAFQRLATALEARAQELTPIPESQWTELCHQKARSYAPISDNEVRQAQRGSLSAWMP